MPPPLVLRRSFESAAAFLAAYEAELARGGLWLAGATLAADEKRTAVELTLEVPGFEPLVLPARLASVVPPHGLAVVFEDGAETEAALAPFCERLRAGPATGPGTAADRLRRLSTPEKVSLALVADREERFALLRDPNKTVHLYVFKNPRIGLDEVQYAARSPSLSPDALKYLADHREWGADPQVRLALVRNPRTPASVAVRLLDLLPEREVRAFAKGNGRPEVVQAARRKVLG